MKQFLMRISIALRGWLASAIILLLLLSLCWLLLFDHPGSAAAKAPGAKLMLIGRVIESEDLGANGLAAYRLSDFSGSLWIISTRGRPAPGAFVMVWARKPANAQEVACDEFKRVGSF